MNDLLYLFQLSEYEIAPSFRRRLRRKRRKRQYLPSLDRRFRASSSGVSVSGRMRHVDGCRIDPRQRFRRNISPSTTVSARSLTPSPTVSVPSIQAFLQLKSPSSCRSSSKIALPASWSVVCSCTEKSSPAKCVAKRLPESAHEPPSPSTKVQRHPQFVVTEDDQILRRMMFQPAPRHIALHIVVKRLLRARKCKARLQRQRKKPHTSTRRPHRQAACALQPDSAPLHFFHSDKPTLAAGRFVSQQNTPDRERRARRVQFIKGFRQRRAVQLRQLQATDLIPSGGAAPNLPFPRRKPAPAPASRRQ